MKGENLLNQLKNLKEVNMLPLSNDYVFKRIFGKGGNEKILKSLLEAILKINIQKIEVKNPERPKETIDEKLSILDINTLKKAAQKLKIPRICCAKSRKSTIGRSAFIVKKFAHWKLF